MKRCVQILLCAAILCLHTVFGQQAGNCEYVFPKPNSQLVSRETNIIVRPGRKIDRTSIPSASQFIITGSTSGRHEGRAVLSDDAKTIVFSLYQPLADDERVTVKMPEGVRGMDGSSVEPFSFEFKTAAGPNPSCANVIAAEESGHEAPSPASERHEIAVATDSLPLDFPPLKVDTLNSPASGELFLGGFSGAGGNTAYANYLLILNNAGKPLAYRRVGTGVNPFEYMFKVDPNGYYSYIERTPVVTSVKIVDTAFSLIDTYPKGNPATTSHADFVMLPNGHALVLYFDIKTIDMSKIVKGGNPAATVWGNLVQEFDLDKNVIFQWSSFDYIPITDTYEDTLAASFDYSHANGIELDSDGNFMLSNRHLSEITKIDRNTGEIIWRMGGKRNQFTFVNEHPENAPTYFSYMHNIRRLSNGNIMMFDNGNQRKPQYSRIAEYKVDEVTKTATLVWEYRHSPDIYASAQGSAQRLSNGNTLIGWGDASLLGQPAVTEVLPDHSTAFELHFPAGYRSMRAYRLPWKPATIAGTRTIFELLQGNTYSFNDTSRSGKTGVRIKINASTGMFYNSVSVEKYLTAPLKPRFTGRSPWMAPYRVTVSQYGFATMDLDMMFDVNQFPGLPDPATVNVFQRDTVGTGVFSQLPATYNSVTKEIVVSTSRVGEFAFCWTDTDSAANPPLLLLPAHRDSVNQKLPVSFTWNPRGTATGYQLEVAQDSLFKTLILNDSLLTRTSDTLKLVAPRAFYCWRVRSRNQSRTSDWAQARIFTTMLPYVSVTSPANKEIWPRGLPYFVKWLSNIKEAVRIDLFKGANRLLTIKDSVPNVGAYSWTIPSGTSPDSTYKIRVTSVADSSVYGASPGTFAISSAVTKVDDKKAFPEEFALFQNYPNPFNPATAISYQLSAVSAVKLTVYDALGRRVATLVNEEMPAGFHTVTWNAQNYPSGIYIYRIVTGDRVESKKMMLVK